MKKRLGKGNFNKDNFTMITDHELERKVLDHFLNGVPIHAEKRQERQEKKPFKKRKKIVRKFKGKKEVKKDLNDLYKSTYNKVQMR